MAHVFNLATRFPLVRLANVHHATYGQVLNNSKARIQIGASLSFFRRLYLTPTATYDVPTFFSSISSRCNTKLTTIPRDFLPHFLCSQFGVLSTGLTWSFIIRPLAKFLFLPHGVPPRQILHFSIGVPPYTSPVSRRLVARHKIPHIFTTLQQSRRLAAPSQNSCFVPSYS